MAPFSAFWGSSMPKRLIRYALSRIDLLDQDAVDLENLDFAWGRNTVLEFRDVAIRADRLQNLLQLPESFSILRAKVLSVRLSIPVDLYASPISIEINGVQVQIRVTSKNKRPENPTQPKPELDVDIVLNTTDLAQSFLDAQPAADREKLEKAIVAEAKDLGASMDIGDSEDEEDLAYGTGQGLSLPTFIADFLQGMVDRMQVQIRNVAFQLDVEVPADLSSSTPDIVTFEMSLESIDVEGVTSEIQPLEGESEHTFATREGKRHISLNNARAFLISEANVFTMFARTSSMPSSQSAQSPVLTERSPPSREPSDMAQSIIEATTASIYESPAVRDPLQDSEAALNIPYDFNDLGSDPEDGQDFSSPSTPRASMFQPTIREEPPAQPGILQEDHGGAPVSSEELLGHEIRGLDVAAAPTSSPPSTPPSQPLSEPLSDEPGGNVDELAQSRVFTNEEASSMYMSAVSEIRSSTTMPGGWDSNESTSSSDGAGIAQTPTKPQNIPSSQPQGARVRSSSSEQHRDEVTQLQDSVQTLQISPKDKPGKHSEASERQDEEAPTPRGPARLAKEILAVQRISIHVPSNHKHITIPVDMTQQLPEHAMAQSAEPHMPGAFSIHAASLNADLPAATLPATAPLKPDGKADRSIEVDLAPLRLQFDAPLGFLLVRVLGELLDALQPSKKRPQRPASGDANQTHNTGLLDLKLNAQEIRLNFLEKLPCVSRDAERALGLIPASLETQVLLSTAASGLRIAISNLENGDRTTNVDLKSFTFGYPDEPILSFDRDIQMQSSIRDAFPASGSDASLQIKQSGGISRCELKTLPLLIRLDLLRLDDTFSWFGGISSFLNMGASMSSNSSQHNLVKNPAKLPQRRGVRFEGQEPPPPDTAKLKIDMRVGGVHIDVVGKDCSAVLRSSALKVIVRDSRIGLGITTVRLDGPYKPGQPPPVRVVLSGLRLEYQPEPEPRDLDRLLSLITPSKFKFDQGYDEIMVDPLLRQRRKGPVMRVVLDSANVDARHLAHLDCLPSLGEDLARLATVAKYLPEDDRPGLLTFFKASKVESSISCGGRLGTLRGDLRNLEVAHISLPMLIGFAIGNVSIKRNQNEDLIGHSGTAPREPSMANFPVIMARYIGNEIDPVVKVKLRDVRVEYRVPTIMDFLGLSADATPQDFEAAMAQSVANLGDQAHAAMTGKGKSVPKAGASSSGSVSQTKVDITFTDCLFGLNPQRTNGRMMAVLTDAHLAVHLPKNDVMKVQFKINNASVVLVDNSSILGKPGDDRSARRRVSDATSPQLSQLCKEGYVSILYTSSAFVQVDVEGVESEQKFVTVTVKDTLLVLETCADSTQTAIALANSLAPPTPPSKQVRFRTSGPIIRDLMASVTGEAFGHAEGDYDFEADFGQTRELADSGEGPPGTDSPLDVQSQYLEDDTEAVLFDASSSQYSDRTTTRETGDGVLLSIQENIRGDHSSEAASDSGSELVIEDNFFGKPPPVENAAHRWSSKGNAYDKLSLKREPQRSPLKVSVQNIHVIWNLYDGYDWAHTRTLLTDAFVDMETRAYEKTQREPGQRRNSSIGDGLYEEDDGTEVGDVLFNSIYIAIPSSRSPQDVAYDINRQLGDNGTDTESIAATNITSTTARAAAGYKPRSQAKRLRLNRSKRHKISFELQGLSANVLSFPTGETQSSVDVWVRNLIIYDNVPTSTWRKFATCQQDVGEREMDTSMVHLELLTVKPVNELAATEMVVKVNVLPLRLHVDQDALEFITRFFEFKDDSVPVHGSASDVPFIQRVEVTAIPVKLDFKPKRVDYLALRSGRTAEFMNFVVLEESNLVLRRIILYGIPGFDRLGNLLNDLWTADVKSTQLPTVLAGLASAKPLVDVGSGFRDLVSVPIREYRRDGRILRSLRKGAAAFVRNTGTGVVKLGAKLAIGTQNVLEGAEELVSNKAPGIRGGWDDDDPDDETERKQISLYAHQPSSFTQGIAQAYASLANDLSVARDAIVAIPTDVAQSQNATGAAKAILGKAPTLVFAPTIGATKAIGKTLLGATNSLDKSNRRRVEDKYKQ